MKILLINPPALNTMKSSLPQVIEEGRGFAPPLGLMYIAAYLEKNTDNKIEILDSQVEEISYDKLEKEIRKRKPDVIGLTAMTFTLIDVIKTAKIVKRINPGIKIILGGPHPTIYPEETAKIREVDFCVVGEGEEAALKLIGNLNEPEKLKKIRGLAFRDKNQIINTGQSDFLKDLDALPFPARHLTPYKKYSWSLSPFSPITTMFSSRGCPYKCLFCDRPQLGKSFRARSAENVVAEMEECQKMGIREIFMYDDTFGVDRQRVLDICAEIKRRGLTIAWDIRTRVNTVDEEILRALKDAGCQRIHYGVEAGTQKILNVLRKGITLEQVGEAFALTKKIGIETAAYFMIGSPEETKEDILETIRFMKKLNPDYVHITIATPYPATDLYRMGIEQGVLPSDCWREFAENPRPDFRTKYWEKELSGGELQELLILAYKQFYIRPKYVWGRLLRTKSLPELWRKTKTAIKIIRLKKE